MKEKELNTTVEAQDYLWSTLDRQRATARTVTIDRDKLVALLIDHAAMVHALFSSKYRREA